MKKVIPHLFFAGLAGLFAWLYVATNPWNSDVFYTEALFRDWVSGTPPSGWHFSAAPFFFPDWPIYFFFRSLTGQMNFTLFLYIFSLVELTLYSARYFFDENRELKTLLFFMTFLTVFPREWHVLFLPAHHGAQWIFGSFLALFFFKQKTYSSRWISFFVTISGLLLSSDLLFGVNVLLPLAFAGGIEFYQNGEKSIFLRRALLGIGTCLAAIVFYVIFLSVFHLSRIGFGVIAPGEEIVSTVKRMAHYGAGLKFGLILILLAIFQMLKEFKSNSLARFYSFGIFLTLFFVIFAHLWIDASNVRYLYVLLFGVSLFFTHFLWRFENKKVYFLITAGFLFFFSLQRLNSMAKDYVQNPFKELYPSSVQCFDAHVDELGSSLGFSSYWSSKDLRLTSHRAVSLIPVDEHFVRFNWIDNSAWYEPFRPAHFFVTKRDKDLFTLAFYRQLGETQKVIDCGEYEIRVYSQDLTQLGKFQ